MTQPATRTMRLPGGDDDWTLEKAIGALRRAGATGVLQRGRETLENEYARFQADVAAGTPPTVAGLLAAWLTVRLEEADGEPNARRASAMRRWASQTAHGRTTP